MFFFDAWCVREFSCQEPRQDPISISRQNSAQQTQSGDEIAMLRVVSSKRPQAPPKDVDRARTLPEKHISNELSIGGNEELGEQRSSTPTISPGRIF